MKLLKTIYNWLGLLKSSSQLEYYIRAKQPQSHAEVERLVRAFYNMRSL